MKMVFPSASACIDGHDNLTVLTCQGLVIDTSVSHRVDCYRMFVKVFSQILDSSISANYELRHFFEDMLKLADRCGIVDMTPEAIARRINLPPDKVLAHLAELEQPDPSSRSAASQGRRITRLHQECSWGWQIVNYLSYRAIRSDDDRKEYNRAAKQRSRARLKCAKSTETGNNCAANLPPVTILGRDERGLMVTHDGYKAIMTQNGKA